MTAGFAPALTLGGVSVERNVPARMRDGTVLRSDIYHPGVSGDHPLLLMRTPYDKSSGQNAVYQHPVWYARHGYIVVVQDTRGRFASEGKFDPFRSDAEDGFDTIRWASQLPGSNGKVGLYGFSYAGAVQLLAAAEGPPELVCIAPGFTASDLYDGWTYEGGTLNLAFVVSWVFQLLALPDALKRGKYEDAARIATQAKFPDIFLAQPLRDLALLRETGMCPYFFDWLEHDTRDGYWEGISIRSRFDRIRVPSLHLGGWYDAFVEGTLANFAGLTERTNGDQARAQRLIVGPWAHLPWARLVGARDFGEDADNFLDSVQIEWFDYWLKGRGNILDSPRVRLFTMGEDRWREADAWPPSEARVEQWYLRSSGRASSLSGDGVLSRSRPGDEPPDIFAYVPQDPVPSAGGRSCCRPDTAPIGPFDQSYVETRNDVLVYSTPPLEQDLEVTGTVLIVLYAATDAPDTDWTAKLVDVDEDGHAINLCDGIIRARFRESLEHPKPLEPDRVYAYHFRVGSTSNLFTRGHRIRLEVSSSNFPTHDANPNTGCSVGEAASFKGRIATQAVFHDASRASRILLPVVQR